MPGRVVRLDAVGVIAAEPVPRLPLAGQVAAGQVDHAGGVVDVVGPHRGDGRQAGAVEPGEQFVRGVLDAGAVGHAGDDVVRVHQLGRLPQGPGRPGVADGGQEQGEVAAPVGEDAQVAVDLPPGQVQAVPPGVDLGERVVAKGVGQRGEVPAKDGRVGQLDRAEAEAGQGDVGGGGVGPASGGSSAGPVGVRASGMGATVSSLQGNDAERRGGDRLRAGLATRCNPHRPIAPGDCTSVVTADDLSRRGRRAGSELTRKTRRWRKDLLSRSVSPFLVTSRPRGEACAGETRTSGVVLQTIGQPAAGISFDVNGTSRPARDSAVSSSGRAAMATLNGPTWVRRRSVRCPPTFSASPRSRATART